MIDIIDYENSIFKWIFLIKNLIFPLNLRRNRFDTPIHIPSSLTPYNVTKPQCVNRESAITSQLAFLKHLLWSLEISRNHSAQKISLRNECVYFKRYWSTKMFLQFVSHIFYYVKFAFPCCVRHSFYTLRFRTKPRRNHHQVSRWRDISSSGRYLKPASSSSLIELQSFTRERISVWRKSRNILSVLESGTGICINWKPNRYLINVQPYL